MAGLWAGLRPGYGQVMARLWVLQGSQGNPQILSRDHFLRYFCVLGRLWGPQGSFDVHLIDFLEFFYAKF